MYKLKMQNEEGKTHIYFSGDVVDDNTATIEKEWFGAEYVCPKNVREAVENAKENDVISIHLNSNGGDVKAGLEIANYLEQIKNNVIVSVESWCASIASVIALSADVLQMPKNTYLMIHNPTICGVSGDENELFKAYDFLSKMTDNIADFYASKSSKDFDFFKEKMKAETWLSAEECKDIFDKQVVNVSDNAVYSAVAKFKGFENAPIEIKNELQKLERARNEQKIRDMFDI